MLGQVIILDGVVIAAQWDHQHVKKMALEGVSPGDVAFPWAVCVLEIGSPKPPVYYQWMEKHLQAAVALSAGIDDPNLRELVGSYIEMEHCGPPKFNVSHIFWLEDLLILAFLGGSQWQVLLLESPVSGGMSMDDPDDEPRESRWSLTLSQEEFAALLALSVGDRNVSGSGEDAEVDRWYDLIEPKLVDVPSHLRPIP